MAKPKKKPRKSAVKDEWITQTDEAKRLLACVLYTSNIEEVSLSTWNLSIPPLLPRKVRANADNAQL